ncbi:hypothetical protein ABPG72_018149 [Tetrahymena utriculariae]
MTANIFCDTHGQKYPLIYLNIIPEALDKPNFKLLCNKCIVKDFNNNNNGFLVCIDDINNNNKENQIIDNWPPSDNRNLLQQIQDILSGQDETPQILEQLEQKYHQIKQIFNEKIDKYYKQQLNIVNMFSKSYIQQVYQKVRFEIPQNIEDLGQENLKHPYKWWIQVIEGLGSRIQMYSKEQQLLFSKKAKDYFQSDSVKRKQKIFYRKSSQYSKDYIRDALELAKDIQSKAQEIEEKYSQINLIF